MPVTGTKMEVLAIMWINPGLAVLELSLNRH